MTAATLTPDAITTTLAAIDRAATHLNTILASPQRGCDDRAFTAAHDAQNALAGATSSAAGGGVVSAVRWFLFLAAALAFPALILAVAVGGTK